MNRDDSQQDGALDHLREIEERGNEPMGSGWLFLLAFLLLLGLALLLGQSAHGQEVLAPAYDAAAIKATMEKTPKGQEPHVWIIANVDSGPGDELDAQHLGQIDLARGAGFKLVFYVDLKGGGDFSPFLCEDKGKVIATSGPVRFKTVTELRVERKTWGRYGKPAAWFIDDVPTALQPEVVTELATWGRLFLNPGCAWRSPGALDKPGVVVVISESKGDWPRPLTTWEKANPKRCAVLGLSIPAGSLPAFKASTAKLGFCWASPLDDQWRKGQSAYNTVTPYLSQLLTP